MYTSICISKSKQCSLLVKIKVKQVELFTIKTEHVFYDIKIELLFIIKI